jgi:hypothetical protein
LLGENLNLDAVHKIVLKLASQVVEATTGNLDDQCLQYEGATV